MRLRKTINRDLPPRMLRRVRPLKNGKTWIGYYYDGRTESGKRVEIPLGSDLDIAKIEWARLEHKAPPAKTSLLGQVFDRYEREIIPGKAHRTQKDNLLSLTQLRKAFSDAPIEAVTPQAIAQYRDKRTGKVRANREISLLSHIYNIAREWGLTDKENPAAGVRKNKETPRAFYASAEIWDAVYKQAVPELRDAMDLAYLTGQRPGDVLSMRAADVVEGFLQVAQGKTAKKLRIRLSYGDNLNQLSDASHALQHDARETQHDIQAIMVSLQFQDRTDQMLEHVQTDLQNLLDAIVANDPSLHDAQAWLARLRQRFTTDEERHGQPKTQSSAEVTFF